MVLVSGFGFLLGIGRGLPLTATSGVGEVCSESCRGGGVLLGVLGVVFGFGGGLGFPPRGVVLGVCGVGVAGGVLGVGVSGVLVAVSF